MKNIKKAVTFITALAMLTSLASCSGKTSPEEKPELQHYTAEKLSVAAYKKEKLPLPADMMQAYSFMPYNGSKDCLLLGAGNVTPSFWHTDSDFSSFEPVEFPEFDVGVNYDIDTADDGTVVTFVTHADYGDLPPITAYSYPEDYDEKVYDAAAKYSFMIKTYSPDGKLLTSVDVEDFGLVPDKKVSYGGVHSDGKLVIAKLGGTYEMFDINGKYLGELETSQGDITSIGHAPDGGLICAMRYKDGETDKFRICRIDSDGKLSEYNSIEYDYDEMIQTLLPGRGEYSTIIITRMAVFGIKADTGEMVHLLDIRSSGVSFDFIKGVLIADDGNVVLLSNDFKNYSVNLRKYIPRSEEEMASIPVLTLGMVHDDNYLNDFVNDWNDEGHDFLVEIKSYDSSDEGLFDTLAQDIVSGELPDIMLVEEGGIVESMNIIDLGGMGAFCDLYEFMDKDDTYTRDAFVPNVLNCFERDGKFIAMPDRFSLDLGRVCKKKFIESADGWNRAAAVDFCINSDPEMIFWNGGDSKNNRLYANQAVSWNDWTDLNAATCDFESPDFIRFLNWCNEPENQYYESSEEQKPVEEWTDEDHDENFRRQQTEYLEDRSIFGNISLITYENYLDNFMGEFGGEELTFFETPELECRDCLAISAKSEHKDLAWEFIRYRISDEYISRFMSGNSFRGCFPVTKSGLKKFEEYERSHYTDYSKFDYLKGDPEWENYKGVVYQISLYDMKKNIQLGEITDEDVKAVNDLIASAGPRKRTIYPDYNYYRIVEEEMDRFFAGECTAEECAKVLQNRMIIYISERF